MLESDYIMSNVMTKNSAVFIGLSLLSIGSLIGSFSYPLQKLHLYRQVEKGAFNTSVTRTYLLTEHSLNYPYGFQPDRAKLYAQIHVDYKLQKMLLLSTAIIASVSALVLGNKILPSLEFEQEVERISLEGKKELKIRQLKQELALKSKASQILFVESMRELMDSPDSTLEEEIQSVDEIAALYSEVEENLLPKEENQVQPASSETDFRSTFPTELDNTSWKAISRAIAEGCSKDEIIRDVLGGGDLASAYFEYLKSKFL